MNFNIVYDFAWKVLKYKRPEKMSVFEYGCLALAKRGYPKQPIFTEEQWLLRYWQFMVDYTKKPKLKKKQKPVVKITKKDLTPFSQTKEFLESYEWKKLRLEALLKHGRKCQCCGTSPETGAVLNVDHIKPRKTHPELALTLSNLQVLCHDCNHGKGNWNTTDFRTPDSSLRSEASLD